jgi:hypothetical protein
VTQVAEVAVNNAGRKPQETPLREATGNVSNTVPRRMIAANASAITLAALRFLGRFFIHTSYSPDRRLMRILLSSGNTSPKYLIYYNQLFFLLQYPLSLS